MPGAVGRDTGPRLTLVKEQTMKKGYWERNWNTPKSSRLLLCVCSVFSDWSWYYTEHPDKDYPCSSFEIAVEAGIVCDDWSSRYKNAQHPHPVISSGKTAPSQYALPAILWLCELGVCTQVDSTTFCVDWSRDKRATARMWSSYAYRPSNEGDEPCPWASIRESKTATLLEHWRRVAQY